MLALLTRGRTRNPRNYGFPEPVVEAMSRAMQWDDPAGPFMQKRELEHKLLDIPGVLDVCVDPDGMAITYDELLLTPDVLEEQIDDVLCWALDNGYFPYRKNDRSDPSSFRHYTRRRLYEPYEE